MLPAKSGSQCAGKEKEAKAWSTIWEALEGTVPGAATSIVEPGAATTAERRGSAARRVCCLILRKQSEN